MVFNKNTPVTKDNGPEGAAQTSSARVGGLFSRSDELPHDYPASSKTPTSAAAVPEPNQQNPAQQQKSVRKVVGASVLGFFDCNWRYLLGLRGILNLFEAVGTLVTLSLLSTACQFRPAPSSSVEGFFCKPPETFLFVVSCGAFCTSLLYLVCCLSSKQTSYFLYRTSFEASYFIFYFILLVTASISLMISIINWDSERIMYERNYDTLKIAIIVGLMVSAFYGVSALWFFISHHYYRISRPQVDAE